MGYGPRGSRPSNAVAVVQDPDHALFRPMPETADMAGRLTHRSRRGCHAVERFEERAREPRKQAGTVRRGLTDNKAQNAV